MSLFKEKYKVNISINSKWKWPQIQKCGNERLTSGKCCFMQHVYTGTPHFITFHFTALHRYYVSYKLKVCGSPALSKSISAIFPTAFSDFVSLCHIVLAILAIFRTFSFIFVMVICGQ